MPRLPYRRFIGKERSLFCPRLVHLPTRGAFNTRCHMLLAIAGILLILGLLGLAAFLCAKECGKEQSDDLLGDGQVIGRTSTRSARLN
jgi:hypothetical protein